MTSHTLAPEEPLPRFDLALCRARPGLPWFGGGEPRDIQAAVALCCRCPELDPCHRWADQHDEAGIWGGLTQRQREVMRAERGRFGRESGLDQRDPLPPRSLSSPDRPAQGGLPDGMPQRPRVAVGANAHANGDC